MISARILRRYIRPKIIIIVSKMSEIKQVKYLDHLVTDIGTRNEPFLLHVTRGQRDDSFIFHFK